MIHHVVYVVETSSRVVLILPFKYMSIQLMLANLRLHVDCNSDNAVWEGISKWASKLRR